MSRGGREAADWVEAAWRRGARFDAWTEHFDEDAWRAAADEVGIVPEDVAQVQREPGYVMPWAHISAGVSSRFLARERRRAEAGETTPDCTFGPCTGCGACPTLGVDNELAAPRVAQTAAERAGDGASVEAPTAGAAVALAPGAGVGAGASAAGAAKVGAAAEAPTAGAAAAGAAVAPAPEACDASRAGALEGGEGRG